MEQIEYREQKCSSLHLKMLLLIIAQDHSFKPSEWVGIVIINTSFHMVKYKKDFQVYFPPKTT